MVTALSTGLLGAEAQRITLLATGRGWLVCRAHTALQLVGHAPQWKERDLPGCGLPGDHKHERPRPSG